MHKDRQILALCTACNVHEQLLHLYILQNQTEHRIRQSSKLLKIILKLFQFRKNLLDNACWAKNNFSARTEKSLLNSKSDFSLKNWSISSPTFLKLSDSNNLFSSIEKEIEYFVSTLHSKQAQLKPYCVFS